MMSPIGTKRTSQGAVDRLGCGNLRLTSLLKFPEVQMSRMTALVLAMLGSLYLPGQAFAQLTPPAGSAGAGNSAISGVPYGPAIPGSFRTPAASEMPQVCRRSAATPRRPWSPRHRRHRHGSSPGLLIRTRRSRSSTRILSSREARHRLAGEVASRSAPSLAFAGGVRARLTLSFRARTSMSRLLPTAEATVRCGNGFEVGFSPYRSTRLNR